MGISNLIRKINSRGNIFLKEVEIIRFKIIKSELVFINNNPYWVYTINCPNLKQNFKSDPELSELYLGKYLHKGCVGKYYHENSYGGMLDSYIDCKTYMLSNKDIAGIKLEDIIIWKNVKIENVMDILEKDK